MLAMRSSSSLTGVLRLAASRPTAARSVSTFTRSYPSFQQSPSDASRPAFFQQSFIPTALADSFQYGSRTNSGKSKLGASLVISILAGVITAHILSSDPLKLETAPAAAAGLTSIAADSSKQVVVHTDTNLSFPIYLPTPASTKTLADEPKFRLVGLGVRTVSFLRVKVYVAALYVDESKLSERLRTGSNDKTLEETVKDMLDDGTSAVIRIVPVRNTDFNHLRDGFIRALQNRLKKAIKQSRLQADSPLESQFQQDIQQIKDSFPRGSVPKGSPLDLVILPTTANTKPASTSLHFEYDNQIFGQVKPSSAPADAKAHQAADAGFTVARELVLAYFADKGEISTAFKKSVQDGLQNKLPSNV